MAKPKGRIRYHNTYLSPTNSVLLCRYRIKHKWRRDLHHHSTPIRPIITISVGNPRALDSVNHPTSLARLPPRQCGLETLAVGFTAALYVRWSLTNGVVNPRNGPSTTIGSIPSTPRGPPRKPKQSGNALWVGNLPSGANVTELKDHFSKDATKEIESVFLISKSNCAFVNYKSESACAEAMARFHDSRFNGVRLVCRLRRTPMANSVPGVPTGPAALTSANAQNQTALDAIAQNREESSKALEQATSEITASGEPAVKVPNKYFVMKSLTVEDMELSVRNSIWATQSHNE